MSDAMGTVRVDIEIEHPAGRGEHRAHESVLVDTSAELSWVPAELFESLGIAHYTIWRFRQTDGSVIERRTGAMVVDVAGDRTSDDISGEPGDLILLGARSLEGLNLRLEPVSKRNADPGSAPPAELAYTSILAHG